MKNLEGKAAAVSGAGSGIGRALARELAAAGCHLSLCDLDASGLKETASGIQSHGVNILTSQVDVSNPLEMQGWADETARKMKHVDIVINNAGVGTKMRFAESTLEDLHWVMNINFWGVVHGSHAFLPYLLERPEAVLCNVSSVFGLFTSPDSGSYCSSKAAVHAFTQTLAQEYAAAPLEVCCVYPGGIRTNIARNTRLHAGATEDDHNENIRKFEQEIARTTPEQAAQTILKGIRHGRPRIMVGSDAHIYNFLSRLMPVTWQKLVRWAIERDV